MKQSNVSDICEVITLEEHIANNRNLIGRYVTRCNTIVFERTVKSFHHNR